MNLGKSILKLFFISVILLSFSDSFAINGFQKTSLKSDGSGSIKLSYWVKASEIKGVDEYKSFPFSEGKIKSYYSSDNNSVDNISINKNSPETTYVNISINFKYIANINSAPGFSKVKATWFKSGDSTVFLYKVDKTDDAASDLKMAYTFELPTTEILRTSGFKSQDNAISWNVTSELIKNGFDFYVVFKQSDKNVAENESQGSNNNPPAKSCGPFGIELPLIFFSTFFYILSEKKKIK